MRVSKRRHTVGRFEDLPPGSVKIVPVGKFGVGVYNVGGHYYALTNYCPHRGAPVCKGVIGGLALPRKQPYEVEWVADGEYLRCPWHGWQFQIATGSSVTDPRKVIHSYPVIVEGGLVILDGV
jgi:nitrite reductase/ring-hydroxylating ferredoxin subunit